MIITFQLQILYLYVKVKAILVKAVTLSVYNYM